MKTKKKSAYFNILVIFILGLNNTTAFGQINDSLSFLTTPTGAYKVGIKEIYLTDSSRFESYSRKKKLRQISVKIWYPIDNETSMAKELYLASYPTNILFTIFKSKNVQWSFFDSLKHYNTYSYLGSSISTAQDHFPVLIFSPGYYFGISDLYSCTLENLASNGYIVCCVNHPYEQPYIKFPNGDEIFLNKAKTRLAYLQLMFLNLFRNQKSYSSKRLEKTTRNTLKYLKIFDKALKLWVCDSDYFIDYMIAKSKDKNDFFSKIDINNIGALGHSFGGAVSGQICKVDKRIKAGVNMDCFQFGNIIDNPLDVPFMLIESSNYPDWNLGNRIIYSYSQSDFYRLSLLKTSHFIFSDVAVMPFQNQQIGQNFTGGVNGRKSISLINSYVLGFFDLYLKGKPMDILEEKVDNAEIKFDFRNCQSTSRVDRDSKLGLNP